MRDIFEDIFKGNPLDPIEAARRNMRPDLRKRFYETVAVEEVDGQFRVTLDGRIVRTPARRELAAPSRALAEVIAAEWDAQKDVIDPAAMPLTRLANSIIDGVADQSAAVTADIVRYLGSDLLFYRAEGPAGLIEMQELHWDPIVAWARDALGARFILAEGVVFVRQPEEAVEAARRAIPTGIWSLGAVHAVMTLTGSPLLALALAHGHADAGQVWTAAHIDEDWNMTAWGRDTAALERREQRFREFAAAAQILRQPQS
jgi:chaperone required for assembly of F1-ATPase